MSLKKTLIKNTSFNLAGYAYLLLASFFSLPILLLHLGREVLGVYLLLASIIPLASVLDFGLGNAVVRKLSLPETSQEEKNKTWQTSFCIYLTLSLLLSLAIFNLLSILSQRMAIFQTINPQTLTLATIVISIIVFINHLNSNYLNLSQAEQRFDIFNLKTFLVGSANTLLAALLVTRIPNIAALFVLQLFFHLLTFLILTRYSLSLFPFKEFLPRFNLKTARQLINFGLRDFIGTLSGQIEAQFSKYALGALVSAQAITAFSIPQTIVLKAAGVVSQIAIAFFPFSASLLKKDKIHKLKRMILSLEALIFILGLAAIALTYAFAQPFLAWWLKDQVIVNLASPILKILSIYFVLIALTPIPTVVIQSLNYPQVSSFFAFLTTAIQISLIFFLTPQFGLLGVAYATLISVLITIPTFLIVAWFLFRKRINQLGQ